MTPTPAPPPTRAWSMETLVLDALKSHFAALPALESAGMATEIGWVGNKPITRPILSLEAGRAIRAEEMPRVISVEEPEEPEEGEEEEDVTCQAVVEYGCAELPITANLYVSDSARGKTKREELLDAIEGAFAQAPGSPACLNLELNNAPKTRAVIWFEDAIPSDTPEGVRADEWRAIITMRAHYALQRVMTLPYCRDIGLMPQIGDIVSEEIMVSELTAV